MKYTFIKFLVLSPLYFFRLRVLHCQSSTNMKVSELSELKNLKSYWKKVAFRSLFLQPMIKHKV